jgi:hypothetical protein
MGKEGRGTRGTRREGGQGLDKDGSGTYLFFSPLFSFHLFLIAIK